jgi:5'/3'-nucleotidase SurE
MAVGALGGGSSAAAESPATAPQPLDILLTNDDGWNAPGISAVYDALTAAGHHVTLVAPATNQSGAGARVTFGGALVLTQQQPHKFSVNGTPADAAEVGLSLVLAGDPPDLVISGTNTGQNIAAATIHSGTVGAAATALKEGVPAIAISTEQDFGNPTVLPYGDTAAWLVRLVGALKGRAHGAALLPAGIGLNINYPIVGTAAAGGVPPAGVAWTETGNGFLDVTYGNGALPAVGASVEIPVRVNPLVPETLPNADTTALANDYISVTPIEGDYDAPTQALGQLRNTVVGVR